MTYLNITGGTMFLMAVYNVMLQILRCNGFPKIGLYISILMNLINIGGNYLFHYGPLLARTVHFKPGDYPYRLRTYVR